LVTVNRHTRALADIADANVIEEDQVSVWLSRWWWRVRVGIPYDSADRRRTQIINPLGCGTVRSYSA
jgi:hypothetical protein